MTNFYIVDPLVTSFGYIYYLDACRKAHGLDLSINLVLTGKRTDYPFLDGAHLCSSIVFLQEGQPLVHASDVVIAGSDTAIPYVSSLRSRNKLRQNKGLYLAALPARHRLDMFHYTPETEPSEALTWARENLPVFIKPVNGTGSEDVHCVRTLVEFQEMLKYLITQKGYKELVLQKKHEGKEIQIDLTSSMTGAFGVTAIWTAYRGYRNYSWLENYDELSPTFKASLSSLIGALRGLDTVYGLYHVETIFDGTDLKVIEINFRRHGHITFQAYRDGCGYSQIEADVISYLWPRTWEKRFSDKVLPRLKYTARMWIRNRITKYIEFDVNEVSALPSVAKVIPHSNLFNRVVEPSSEFAGTYLAAVILQNYSSDQLHEDLANAYAWAESRFG